MVCLLENQHFGFMKQVFIILILGENVFATSKLFMALTLFLKKRMCSWEILGSMTAHANYGARQQTSHSTIPDRKENSHKGHFPTLQTKIMAGR